MKPHPKSPVSLLFHIMLIVVCVIINSSQADQQQQQQQQQQAKDERTANIRDPVTDLGRLKSKPSSELPRQANGLQPQVTDQQAASANLESLVLGQVTNNLATDEIVLDESQLPIGLQSLLPLGKRRFDAKEDELSSTGQLEGNKFVIPHTPLVGASELLAASSRGRNFQKRPLDGRMLSRIVDNGPAGQFASRVNEANDQLANMNQNYNRRALMVAQQQMASSRARQQRQEASKRRPAGGRGQQNGRQESRKSQSSSKARLEKRPLKGKDRVEEEEEEGDSEKASDRRSDAFGKDDEGATGRSARDGGGGREEEAADQEERDDEDDHQADNNEGDSGRPPVPSGRNKLRQSASNSGRRRATTSRGGRSAEEGDKESGNDEDGDDDDDESADSSNTKQVALDQVQAKMTNTNRRVIEVVHEPLEEGSNNLKQGAVINTELEAAAGHHHGHHGHYYQYVEVPKKKAWKFGFKRGNHKHEIARHEKGHKHKFHSSFKWHAKEKCKKKSKCKSVGKMTWDYKHHKKHHHRRR